MIGLIAVLGMPCVLHAQADKPVDIHVGMYINELHEINMQEGFFIADFWIWFRWVDSACAREGVSLGMIDELMNPIESFEVTNGQIESRTYVSVDSSAGFYYGYARILARVTKRFDLWSYPMDSHVLDITIEDGNFEQDVVRYIPDLVNTTINPEIDVPGWDLEHIPPRVTSHVYKSNFGDLTLPTGSESSYSRVLFSVAITKDKVFSILKTFWATILAVLMGLMALLINPTAVDPRFGLGVGSVFAVVANTLVVSSGLADSNQIVYSDAVQVLAALVILSSIVESVISFRFVERGLDYETQVRKWDFRIAAFFLCLFVCGFIAATWYYA